MIKESKAVKKIRTETGASITFALLLFLVCAALSAVVLVAATVAAGRLSNIVEADQKYYAVMSAVDLINDSMDDKAISTVELNNDNDKKKDFLKPMNEVNESDIKAIDQIDTALNKETYDGDDDKDDEQIDYSDTDPGTASTEENSFEKVITDLYNDKNVSSGSHVFTFKDINKSTVESMVVSVSETVDRNNGIVKITVAPAGSTNGMMLVYSVDTAEKYPPVTQVEVDGSEREVTSAYETRWHLVKMVSTFDENGDT